MHLSVNTSSKGIEPRLQAVLQMTSSKGDHAQIVASNRMLTGSGILQTRPDLGIEAIIHMSYSSR